EVARGLEQPRVDGHPLVEEHPVLPRALRRGPERDRAAERAFEQREEDVRQRRLREVALGQRFRCFGHPRPGGCPTRSGIGKGRERGRGARVTRAERSSADRAPKNVATTRSGDGRENGNERGRAQAIVQVVPLAPSWSSTPLATSSARIASA